MLSAALVAVSLVAGPSGPDAVEIKALPRPAVWTNAPKDFKRLADDAFSITAGKETDLYNNMADGSRAASAPMLTFPADETFVLTTAVKVDFQKEFDGGFLVVYADPDHWTKLLFEKSHYGPFSVCSNVTNGDTDDTVNPDAPSNEVYLRIARAKDMYTLYSSVDGKAWTYIRFFRFAVKGPVTVGFGAQAPVGTECRAVFSKIRYSTKEVKDFWTGEPAP